MIDDWEKADIDEVETKYKEKEELEKLQKE